MSLPSTGFFLRAVDCDLHQDCAPCGSQSLQPLAFIEIVRTKNRTPRQQLRPMGEGLSLKPILLITKLAQARIGASKLSTLNRKLSPFADQESYYAPFLFGSWNVTATLKPKLYPYGTDFVPSHSLVEGSPRNRRELHHLRTALLFHLGWYRCQSSHSQSRLGSSPSRISADRAYAARSISRAYRQLTPVEEVDWDPEKDPTRLSLVFAAGLLAEDLRPLGQRLGEVYITARDSEHLDENVFCPPNGVDR